MMDVIAASAGMAAVAALAVVMARWTASSRNIDRLVAEWEHEEARQLQVERSEVLRRIDALR